MTEEGLTLLRGWARAGLDERQIAKEMGVGLTTLARYKEAHEEIQKALCRTKDVVDFEVEEALLEKIGAGDTAAIKYWLNNRAPRRWRDKPEMESPEDKMPVEVNIRPVARPDFGEEAAREGTTEKTD